MRWLKPVQVWGRLHRLLNRPRVGAGPTPPLRPADGPWALPARRAPSLLGPRRLQFLNQTRDLDGIGWDDAGVPLLWRYNLHYFDDLNAHGAEQRRDAQAALIEAWIAANPPGRGCGWDPYPTSLRIVNWLKAFAGGWPARAAWLDSLAAQARWLAQDIEWHLLGNHLFANGKALLMAGLVLDGPEAAAWRQRGAAIVERELPEQFLPDGGHFERSPMYHALALEDLLDLVNAIRRQGRPVGAAARIEQCSAALVPPMIDWLRAMTHPDGSLARFNDCADGIAPDGAELIRYAGDLGLDTGRPGPASVTLAASGYHRLAAGAAVLLADAAPIGPDYLPGHAHADTLSYELSLRGRRLVVNRGTSVYGLGARRQLERGTAAHSTLQLGGHDSSEVWAGFRVGRRARVERLAAAPGELGARHDGYAHLPGRPCHARHWQLGPGGLTVIDRIEPRTPLQATVRHHLAPGLRCRRDGADGRFAVIDEAGDLVAQVELAGKGARVETWDHALGFGSTTRAETLAIDAIDGRVDTRWHWPA